MAIIQMEVIAIKKEILSGRAALWLPDRVILAKRSEQSGDCGLGCRPEELCWSAGADFAFLVNRQIRRKRRQELEQVKAQKG